VDESWIDSNITISKCWQGETEFIKKNYNARNKLILLHAGSENGFLHNAMCIKQEQQLGTIMGR
jgi:hypothetical protein